MSWVDTTLDVVGGWFGNETEKDRKRKQEEFLNDKYWDYDLPMWEANKDRLIAQWNDVVAGIQLQQKNEIKLADLKDANNLRNYLQALKIHDYQYNQQVKLHKKSDELYQTALAFNAGSAEFAKKQTKQQQKELEQGYAFQNEENIIEGIIQKGELAAKGVSGRSAAKQQQSQLADQGRQQSIMTESLVSAGINTRMQLHQINIGHLGANIQAHANRMLTPEKGPAPLEPFKTPLTEYQLPRELEDFDFGPQPIKGVSSLPTPNFTSVLLDAAGSAAQNWAANTAGGNQFEGDSNNTNDYGGFSFSDMQSSGGLDISLYSY